MVINRSKSSMKTHWYVMEGLGFHGSMQWLGLWTYWKNHWTRSPYQFYLFMGVKILWSPFLPRNICSKKYQVTIKYLRWKLWFCDCKESLENQTLASPLKLWSISILLGPLNWICFPVRGNLYLHASPKLVTNQLV